MNRNKNLETCKCYYFLQSVTLHIGLHEGRTYGRTHVLTWQPNFLTNRAPRTGAPLNYQKKKNSGEHE